MSSDHIKALELARDGYWDESHQLVQAASDELSCLIHAYLHREEGDMDNAAFWYKRADTTMPHNTLEEEWDRLYRLVSD